MVYSSQVPYIFQFSGKDEVRLSRTHRFGVIENGLISVEVKIPTRRPRGDLVATSNGLGYHRRLCSLTLSLDFNYVD